MKKKLLCIFMSFLFMLQTYAVPRMHGRCTQNTSKGVVSDKKPSLENFSTKGSTYISGNCLIPKTNSGNSLLRKLEDSHRFSLENTFPPVVILEQQPMQNDDSKDEAQEKVLALKKKVSEFSTFLDNCYYNSTPLLSSDVLQICAEVDPLLRAESSLLEISGPTIIVGDVHSDIGAVKYACERFLEEVQEGTSILFLGDYVDRGIRAPGGPNGVKCVASILKLKTLFPDKVFLLRGNHEDRQINSLDFFGETRQKYGEKLGEEIYKTINNIFELLSLAAVIDGSSFCVHGGICESLKNVNQIKSITKPITLNCNESENYTDFKMGLLWSDPSVMGQGFRENVSRKIGCKYGLDVVDEFLKSNGLQRIVRAHQKIKSGYCDVLGIGKVITIFSAPKYSSESDMGAIIKLSGQDMKYSVIHY